MAENPQDIEQKIKLTYETNAEKTAGEVNDLNKSMSTTTDQTEKTSKATKDLSKSQKDAADSSKSQADALGSMSPGLKGAIDGFKGMIKQMWLMVANPIVAVIAAIVLGLGLLFKAFTSTNDGADKMEQIMAGISATIDVLRDRVLKVGEAIMKFFSGDFKGALDSAKQSVSGIGDEIAAEFKKAADATKSLQEVEDAMRGLGVSRAKLNRDLAEAKDLITDENASYADKKKAIDAVKKAEGLQTEQELSNARKKLKSIQELNALSDTSDKDLQKEADAKIALYNLEQTSAQNRKSIKKEDAKADREEAARIKTINDAKKQAHKEELARLKEIAKAKEALLKEGYDKEANALKALQDLNDKSDEEKLARKKERDLAEIELLAKKGIDTRNLLVLNAELYETLEQELRDKRAEEKKIQDEKEKADNEKKAADDLKAKEEADAKEAAADQAKLDQKKAIQDATLGLGLQGIALAKDLAGKNKAVQKAALIAENAIALAKITMNTIEAVAKDNAASPLTFGMPWSGIHIATGAIGAASVIASTAKGLQALGGGSAGTAPSLSGVGGGGASAAPSVSFQASSENQIATTIADNTNEQGPVKAYVISKEVSTAQEIDRNKIESNSVGN